MAAQTSPVDDYIASRPPDQRPSLEGVREAIRRAAPGAEETISYHMPTFSVDGRRLVYFAAWKKHIGLYPAPAVDAALEADIARYRAAQGTLRFPLDEPIPFHLIQRVVEALVERQARRD